MVAKVSGARTSGVDGALVSVEVDIANGLPRFDIVGLPDAAVKESRERVRTAIKNTGIALRQQKITVSLAPADIRKDSSGLDLPIAVGLLAANGLLDAGRLAETLFAAELSLEGTLRPVQGVLPMALAAHANGLRTLVVAPGNANEALLVDGLTVYAPATLRELLDHLSGAAPLEPARDTPSLDPELPYANDFAEVQGQFLAKRALEIVAAGGHNLLMSGPPGSGKTMLARRLPSIMPAMTKAEALEVTKIHSVAGLLRGGGLVAQRPFRSPHHTTSAVALTGGGSVPRPGEVTLAHHGVLFLDELPEFGKAIEILRQPLEDGCVTVSRVNATLTYPARFILVCAMNPCPCGWLGDKDHACKCKPAEIARYQSRLSGPLLDRIDIHIKVPRVEYSELTATTRAESSASIRARVTAARAVQQHRLRGCGVFCNAQMSHAMLLDHCRLTDRAQALLEQVFRQRHLSARSYDRVIKVSRTIADLELVARTPPGQLLDPHEPITERHVAEAMQLRMELFDR